MVRGGGCYRAEGMKMAGEREGEEQGDEDARKRKDGEQWWG